MTLCKPALFIPALAAGATLHTGKPSLHPAGRDTMKEEANQALQTSAGGVEARKLGGWGLSSLSLQTTFEAAQPPC